jgi:uridine kinase
MMNLNGRKRAEIPVYSFEKHARLDQTTSIYSPHVLILEGIFALYDPRVVELLDMKVPCLPWSLPKTLPLADRVQDLL